LDEADFVREVSVGELLVGEAPVAEASVWGVLVGVLML
jgi:hypothetical protein